MAKLPNEAESGQRRFVLVDSTKRAIPANMRCHRQIVTDFGASALGHALKARGVHLATNTPQRWAERDSVPAQYWPHLEAIGAASIDELMTMARPRKRPENVDQGVSA